MKKRITLLISLVSACLTTGAWALDGEYQGDFRDHLVVAKCGSDVEKHKGYIDFNPDGTWALYDELSSDHDAEDESDDQELAENENEEEDANNDGLDNADDSTDDDLPVLTGTYNREKNRGPINLVVDQVAKDAFSDDLEDDASIECEGAAVTTSLAEKIKLRVVVNKRGDRLRFDQKNTSFYVDENGESHKVKFRSKASLNKI